MVEKKKPQADDERPPICPACGVTMGIVVDQDGATRYICLECGFSDEKTVSLATEDRRRAGRAARIHTHGRRSPVAPGESLDRRWAVGAYSIAKRAYKASLRAD